MNNSSLSSHTSPQPQISPSSPQMWMEHVYKGVDNSHLSVRFGVSVRLSPSVDHLWMKFGQLPGSPGHCCAYSRGLCGRRTTLSSLSPRPPLRSPMASTRHPHPESAYSRGGSTSSTLSPSPTTTTRQNYRGFSHHLHAVVGGQLPYPRDPRICLSSIAHRCEDGATEEDTSEDQS